jgi:hypothetical protein
MERLMALIAHAERFHPEALSLVDRALDIIRELRPGEELLPDEQKLLAKLDPRAFRR